MDRQVPSFTAKCRTMRQSNGFRLTFFCELCGDGYTTPVIPCKSLKEALRLGEQDARLKFNRCESCHRWVCDKHYNENQMKCTDCEPLICAQCGSAVSKEKQYCSQCGAPQLEVYIEGGEYDE